MERHSSGSNQRGSLAFKRSKPDFVSSASGARRSLRAVALTRLDSPG
jgi:hypothetical protein